MRLLEMPKQARIVLGGVIMLLGYSSTVLDVVRKDSDSQIFDTSIGDVGSQGVFCEKHDGGFVADFFDGTFLGSLSDADSGILIQNILHGDLDDLPSSSESSAPPVSEGDVMAGNNAKSSLVKTISRGEFAGSKLVKSEIRSSFYTDSRRLGVPASVVDSVISNLSSKVDFRRSLKRGDRFEILYSPKNEMLCGRITTKRGKAAVYRFGSGTGAAYYFENGQKVRFDRGNFFGSPLTSGLHVSSSFGYRRHPINGRWVNHTGVDFMAAYGTPVHAIFDGTVTRASYYCGYGHCVDIKHRSGYTSRYAHLSGYGVRCGAHVKKGQIIGRVGSSGTSTGSHLHLELAKNNKILNPLSVKMMPGEEAMVPYLRQFNARKRQIDFLFAK